MNRFLSLLVSCIFTITSTYAQEKFTISGIVKDSSNGEVIIGASVYLKENKVGTVTNSYGYFSLSVPKGQYTLVASYIGYKTYEQPLSVTSNLQFDIELKADVVETKEVVIKSKKEDKNVQDTKMSTIDVSIAQIKKLPALFGEIDVLKNIQMLPGIQVAGEGNTGLYVRGGGADQNLILLDEAPVYNAAHVFGVFSVFNSDALKSAEIYKGGIPAQYGGRLSSLLDIRTKDGNNKQFNASGGVGLISSRLTLQGPIVKEKCSFIVSGRRTYADLFLIPFRKRQPQFEGVKLYFYDLNAKINYRINSKNKIFFANYFGKDVLQVAGFGIDWSNATSTLRWNHVYGKKIFSNTTLVYSNFNYGLGVVSGATAFRWVSNLREGTIKQDYTWYANPSNEVSFGISGSYRSFSPGRLEPRGDESIFKPFEMEKFYAIEEAVYLSNKQKLTTRLSVEYGLRYSLFQNIGKDSVLSYNGTPDDKTIVDTTFYDRFELIKNYQGLEPRISMRYLINDRSSIKTSYNRTYQYLHLLSNSSSPLPTAQWIPSTNVITPQNADQIAAGYFRNFKENMYEASVESYYKWMNNVVDFVDNADLIANPNVETEVRRGKGWSYGLEFFFRKSTGKTTGWISYTWSKTEFNIPEVNEGRTYFASYDRRHNFNIVVSHDVNERLNISGNWIYGSGRPITIPTQRFQFGYSIPGYIPSRNNYRIAAYHRLDLSATLNGKKKEGRRWNDSWNFSLYNVYMRKNPFTVFVDDKKVKDSTGTEKPTGEKEIKMIYLFKIIPSVTYNFNF
ncbi:MAG: TonB-dependent receptor [Cytophagaceae bacterium]|nr:TonB-dependent receptor [Cytophagaceae bacterium]MDW8457360.1 TonB-dependent receptor [Cytophagaceae bacterium]